MMKVVGTDSRENPIGARKEASKQGDSRVSGKMEGITYGGCDMGRRAGIAAS